MGLPLVLKLAGIYVAKKVLLLGAIKTYGPGRLYRRLSNWNRYLLRGVPSARDGGQSALGFLFRLPDRLLGNHAKVPSRETAAAAAAALQQQRTSSKLKSSSMKPFSAAPLMQRAREARRDVYDKLPSTAGIRSSIQRGKARASTVLSSTILPRSRSARSASDHSVMTQLREFRRTWQQAQTMQPL